MADLSEYKAAVDRAVDKIYEQAGVSPELRELLDQEQAARQAVLDEHLKHEQRLMEQMQEQAEQYGDAWASTFREAARLSNGS
ncbi:hypothetical protein AB0395_47810 [Streptosporangium sp. NPDC051023]|uniref:hypothetical protein n=1 Tax=Streptosporangium sp. NPDC051023 TaxID=3155410 RepID=UPI00344CFDC8